MPDYRHLLHMTDDVGLLQFSRHSHPDPRSGYTLDDNARALIVALKMRDGCHHALKYATFMFKAQQKDGSWSNFMLDGIYSPRFDSEDSAGRALLACCLGLSSPWKEVSNLCSQMLHNQLYKGHSFRSPRAMAYVLTGLCKSKALLDKESLQELLSLLGDRLNALYNQNHHSDWLWFEKYLTYCNGIIPQAMFNFYAVTGDKKALKVAHDSLHFLGEVLFKKGYLNIIGNNGWYHKGKSRPFYDQQPVDAASTLFAFLDAYQTIGGSEYLEMAKLAYEWYQGKNINQISLYDETTGGCFDALTYQGINLNQGAEAVLSLLLSEQYLTAVIKEPVKIEKSS
ncbi:hypothetical protein [Syntrophomonas erecta]